MNLAECIAPERVCFLSSATKREAIAELIDLLATSPAVQDRHELAQAIWKREELMSTGIGMGIAVPHVRLKSVRQAVMAVGIHREGLADYGSIDGKPVHIVALIAAGEDQHAQYIRLLAQVVDILKQPKVREALLSQETTEGVRNILIGQNKG